jgi:hypothetical protein
MMLDYVLPLIDKISDNFKCFSDWTVIALRVFENRVLRKVFGPKVYLLIGGWRKQHSEELHNSYSSPCITRMMKSSVMRWVGHVARIGDKKCI